ncbi:LOW QUALITY PROTEIN: Hypothetical protein PHPALM_18127 [Phytophthora palmivora]|uniref:Uncharacterized protein n=1 Tax=Phytophthora palmivora TaxID=4796 RepID=A0A2P4XKN7_9STRA|nr:LOW QUALITY PROTEIN: Hypothetical protein PHPALM_18127 [Phytophthora palmivora]
MTIQDHSSDSEEDGEIREDVALNAAFHCKYCVLKVASRETVKNTEPERRQYEPFRSRQELLRTKVIPAHAFLQNEKYGPNGYMQCGSELDPIPIILRRGEFVESYERLFQKWLNYRNVTYEALQSDPEEERRYRQSYAYLRAWQQKQRWQLKFLELVGSKFE